jgi:aspartate-semialdehyde dehydrogenase
MKFENLETIRSLAVVGATGIVGKEFLSLLTEFSIRIPEVKLLASESSVGETLEIGDLEYSVEQLTANSFENVDVAFFCVPVDVTKRFVPEATGRGCLVVDDSSCFRMNPEVPLVVPEVNGSVLREFGGLVISTPNCSTTPLVLTLKPLLDKFGIKRVVVSSYQSVSGAGQKAYDELSEQTVALMNGAAPDEPRAFPHRIAFNCLPQIGSWTASGNTEEEEKIIRETRKILEVTDLKISATAVRVPTFCGHGLSVNVELEEDFESVETVLEMFEATPGLKVLDKPSTHIYPTNVECIGSDFTFVGRVRRDSSLRSGLNFWTIADNLRKGAALNSLQILDTLYNYRRMV